MKGSIQLYSSFCRFSVCLLKVSNLFTCKGSLKAYRKNLLRLPVSQCFYTLSKGFWKAPALALKPIETIHYDFRSPNGFSPFERVLKSPCTHPIVKEVHLDDAVLLQVLVSENGLVPDLVTVDQFHPVPKQVLLLGGHCARAQQGQQGHKRKNHVSEKNFLHFNGCCLQQNTLNSSREF